MEKDEAGKAQSRKDFTLGAMGGGGGGRETGTT